MFPDFPIYDHKFIFYIFKLLVISNHSKELCDEWYHKIRRDYSYQI